MKKFFTLIACLAITMSSYADWTLKIGSDTYPMTLVDGTSPETYTAFVKLAPGSYAATITNGTLTSDSKTTTFTIFTTKIVKFWGQIPNNGKNGVEGLCSEMEYPIANSGWMYLCCVCGSGDNNNGIAYYNQIDDGKKIELKSAIGTKNPSDTYWLTAGSTLNPTFTFIYNNKKNCITKLSLDYTTWKVTVDEATDIVVNVSAAGASTLVAPADLTIPKNVKAYTLAYDNEKKALVANMIENTIPANTPVLLNAAEGTYTFAIDGNVNIETDTKNSKTYMPDVKSSDNVLVGVMQPHYVPVNAYVLQNGEKGIGFYNVGTTSNFKINNYRCYIPASAIPASSARSLSIVFPDGETTGIEEVKTASAKSIKKMVDGRLVIEKNGNTFNAAGQIIK